MSTSPVVQLDPTSVDLSGVSVATATPDAAHPRWGSAYDPGGFAAAAPVWVHPMPGGDVLMINARRWTAATTVASAPGVYSAYTEDLTPSWRQLTVPTGASSNPNGQPANIPFHTTVTNPVVIAGASRPPTLLFLLHSGLVAGAQAAILQRYHLDIHGSIALAAEEVVPGAGGVVFNKGLQYDSPNLVLYGTDDANKVYKITKPWGRVGANKVTQVQTTKASVSNAVGTQLGWQYYTGTGYSADPTELAPITVAGGANLISHGPLSFGSFLTRNQTFMVTVAQSGTSYSAQLWRSLSGQPWAPYGSTIALGSSADDSYLGLGLPLQSQLAANPAAAAMSGALSGIPYALTTLAAPTGGHSLDVAWNIVPITG